VTPLLIFGAGGAAREIAALAADAGEFIPAAFVAPERGADLAGLPVLTLYPALARFPGAHAIAAVGSATLRRAMLAEMTAHGLKIATLVHPTAYIGPRVSLGEGSIVSAGCVLTCDIAVGRGVYLNIAVSVSHDGVLEDFVTLSPGVRLAGAVHVGAGAFLGVGATTINGGPGAPLRIGAHAVVGAGACVTGDVPPGSKVVGVPARPLKSA
jgi:sugar O-acyltransferase (sialic acid O-acetyltransferase NeuD family)